jgi:hypothetical protein
VCLFAFALSERPTGSQRSRGSPKYETTAMCWLERFLTEGSPGLRDAARVTASLAEREPSQ